MFGVHRAEIMAGRRRAQASALERERRWMGAPVAKVSTNRQLAPSDSPAAAGEILCGQAGASMGCRREHSWPPAEGAGNPCRRRPTAGAAASTGCIPRGGHNLLDLFERRGLLSACESIRGFR
jgi:hypothetical protein